MNTLLDTTTASESTGTTVSPSDMTYYPIYSLDRFKGFTEGNYNADVIGTNTGHIYSPSGIFNSFIPTFDCPSCSLSNFSVAYTTDFGKINFNQKY